MNAWELPRFRWRSLAVWRRNLRVWRKLLAVSVVMNFGEPFIYLLGLGFGLGFFIGEMSGMPYLTFLASGVIAASVMQTATFEALYSVFTRMETQQTFSAMMNTPLELDDILLGELLWCATKALFSGVAILAVAWLLGAVTSWSALWVVPVLGLVGLCFAAPALVACAVSPSYDFFSYYQTLLLTPMFILCGVFYPVSTLPDLMQVVVTVLPLTHAVAVVRPLVSGMPVDNLVLHLAVLAGYTLVGYYLALVLVRRRLLV